uniref:rRNA 2'-O-methyltransferase fibrillarin n=1 Tax=Timema cristinae TaxID=61476 RepID=A0A7R9GUE5_TIMCR|nr:unnamed protein product [Timema cristinae]
MLPVVIPVAKLVVLLADEQAEGKLAGVPGLSAAFATSPKRTPAPVGSHLWHHPASGLGSDSKVEGQTGAKTVLPERRLQSPWRRRWQGGQFWEEDLVTEEEEGEGLVAALVGSVDAVEEVVGEGVVAAEEEVEFVEYWCDMLTGGFRGGKNVVIEPHRHEGVFIARGKEDVLVTLNMVPGEAVYGEKRITVEVSLTTRTLTLTSSLEVIHSASERKRTPAKDGGADTKVEYRVWNPFRSKLAAAILGGVDQIHISPGTKVLYLGAASGTTVSHVSDIVGPASCIDSTAQPEAVFASEVKKLQADKLKPQEQITLEPYERDHAVVVGVFRPPAKIKAS